MIEHETFICCIPRKCDLCIVYYAIVHRLYTYATCDYTMVACIIDVMPRSGVGALIGVMPGSVGDHTRHSSPAHFEVAECHFPPCRYSSVAGSALFLSLRPCLLSSRCFPCRASLKCPWRCPSVVKVRLICTCH